MILTIDKLFNDPIIINAVIDRTIAQQLDTIFWQRHLTFERTTTRIFKTYLGTVTGVTAGSVIDRNSNKPLRERHSLGSGYGEVAYLGDRYQMDNDRLDQLQELINKFNNYPNGQAAIIDDIVNFLVDDYRQCILAPHKRMDIVEGSLRSTGAASVTVADNPNGITLIDMELPFHFITPQVSDKSHFLKYLMEQIVSLRATYGNFAYMEMSRGTFIKNIIGSGDFGDYYKQTFSARGITDIPVATSLMSSEVASAVLQAVGLPAIVINEDMVEKADGTYAQCFADDRISLFPTPMQGRMRWHTPYEVTDPVPNKVYTQPEGNGGLYISNVRTDEGRFMEYGCEWIPEFTAPNKIVNFNLTTMNA